MIVFQSYSIGLISTAETVSSSNIIGHVIWCGYTTKCHTNLFTKLVNEGDKRVAWVRLKSKAYRIWLTPVINQPLEILERRREDNIKVDLREAFFCGVK
jgi:hypothetical protein